MFRRNILVSAYGCEPDKGSEPGVGWNWVCELSRKNNVTVITRSNNKDAIESYVLGNDNSLRFIYYDLPKIFRSLKKGDRGLYIYYFFWQIGSFIYLRRLTDLKQFNYAMALTFGSLWMPTFLQFLPIPFVWGPFGGGEAVPKRVISCLPIKSRVMQGFRYILFMTLRWNPFYIHALSKSSLILARTDDTLHLIPTRFRYKTAVLLETGVSKSFINAFPGRVHAARESVALRACFTGRLVSIKNVQTAIRAVHIARNAGADIQFDVYGDGPARESLERLVIELGLSTCVNFHRKVSKNRIIEALATSDVFLFPSLKEGGVWSLIEAMAAGLPVIALDSSGMSVIADHSCGYLIEPRSPDFVVQSMASALVELYKDESLRIRYGDAGRDKVLSDLDWERKIQVFNELLGSVEKSFVTGSRL